MKEVTAIDIASLRSEIRLKLTGDLLELEINDSTLDRIIESALREIQRYICSTKLITVPFQKCIDLSKINDEFDKPLKISSISRVYRCDGFTASSDQNAYYDPMYASQWQILSGVGNLNNLSDGVYNYLSYNTLLQMRNTISTDMLFKYDKFSNKLYINIAVNTPTKVTIEYIPRYDSVDDIVSDYWIDMLSRLSIALTKVVVGRIRSRYTQSNALWQGDGQQLLDEGTAELATIREHLESNTQLCFPID